MYWMCAYVTTEYGGIMYGTYTDVYVYMDT